LFCTSSTKAWTTAFESLGMAPPLAGEGVGQTLNSGAMDPIVLKPGGGKTISVAGNDVLFKAVVARLAAKYDMELA